MALPPTPDPPEPRRRRTRRRWVDKAERIERRQAMHQLIAHAIPRREVVDAMRAKFSMTQAATLRLHSMCITQMAEDEAERRPHYKAQAIRRLHAHVRDAKKRGNFTAIASLERLLAQIEGTLEPVEINVTLDATVRESIAVVLAHTTPERLTQLADVARALREAGQLPALAAPVVEAEPVEDAAE